MKDQEVIRDQRKTTEENLRGTAVMINVDLLISALTHDMLRIIPLVGAHEPYLKKRQTAQMENLNSGKGTTAMKCYDLSVKILLQQLCKTFTHTFSFRKTSFRTSNQNPKFHFEEY